MEEHAERVHSHHVPKAEAGRLRLHPCGDNGDQRTNQSETARKAATAAIVKQGIEQHDDHAENRKHKLRQDTNVISGLRNHRNRIHWPTTLLTICPAKLT